MTEIIAKKLVELLTDTRSANLNAELVSRALRDLSPHNFVTLTTQFKDVSDALYITANTYEHTRGIYTPQMQHAGTEKFQLIDLRLWTAVPEELEQGRRPNWDPRTALLETRLDSRNVDDRAPAYNTEQDVIRRIEGTRAIGTYPITTRQTYDPKETHLYRVK